MKQRTVNEQSDCSEIVPFGYALFEHMEMEHGIILVASELSEIMLIVKSIINKNKNKGKHENKTGD